MGNGLGVTMLATVVPQRGQVVFVQGRSIRRVDLASLEERVLWEDFGEDWICGMPSIDPAETHVMVPLMPAHPELRAEPDRNRLNQGFRIDFGIQDSWAAPVSV